MSEFLIQLIYLVKVSKKLVLSSIELSFLFVFDGLSLMSLDSHLMINDFLLLLQNSFRGLLSLGLLMGMELIDTLLSSCHDLLSGEVRHLELLPLGTWSSLHQVDLQLTVDQLNSVLWAQVIDFVLKIDDCQILDRSGIHLQ